MKELQDREVSEVQQYLIRQGIRRLQVQEELLDHICTGIEVEMTQGKSFEEAFRALQKTFSEDTLQHIQQKQQQYASKQQKRMLTRMTLLSGSLFVGLLFLFNIQLKAADIPDINPVNGDASFQIKTMAQGLDFHSEECLSIRATATGEVLEVNQEETAGKYILIKHPDRTITFYAQLSNCQVVAGQKVQKGQLIAQAGNCQKSPTKYFHYEIIRKGQLLPAHQYFPFHF